MLRILRYRNATYFFIIFVMANTVNKSANCSQRFMNYVFYGHTEKRLCMNM